MLEEARTRPLVQPLFDHHPPEPFSCLQAGTGISINMSLLGDSIEFIQWPNAVSWMKHGVDY